MVLPIYVLKGAQIIGLVVVTSLFGPSVVYAQGGLPLPGGSQNPTNSQGAPKFSAPVPGTPLTTGAYGGPGLVPGGSGGYDKLPLNPGNALARLEEMRNAMPNSRAKDFQDSINGYSDWLSDLADAHWRLYQSFVKFDGTKAQAESERQLCLRFGQLKRQAMLLKAEFLIGQRRYPEALGPLVDIVASEPKTETGRNAYRLLQDIGFSDASPMKADSASASAPVIAPVAAPAAAVPVKAKVSSAAANAKTTARAKPH